MAQPSPFYTHTTNLSDLQHPIATLQSTKKSTPSVRLEVPTEADIPTIKAMFANPENSRLDGSVASMTDAEREAVARKWTTLADPLEQVMFVIFLVNEDGKQTPIGTTGLGWIGAVDAERPHDPARRGAAGVILEPFARGRGYAFESLRMAIDYGLRVLGMVDIRLGTKSENEAMRGLMENKFGIKAEVRETKDQFGNDLFWKFDREDWLAKGWEHTYQQKTLG
jgi:RimJ/RimL family protein N-acetyltransferase